MIDGQDEVVKIVIELTTKGCEREKTFLIDWKSRKWCRHFEMLVLLKAQVLEKRYILWHEKDLWSKCISAPWVFGRKQNILLIGLEIKGMNEPFIPQLVLPWDKSTESSIEYRSYWEFDDSTIHNTCRITLS